MTTIPASLPSAATLATGRALRGALWVTQGLLALAFFFVGFGKATAPIEDLAAQMSWVGYTPAPLVRFIGVAEVLGALGLILPAATRILPVLTAVAGAALALLMVIAAGTHLAHGELTMIVPNVVLGSLAAFVAWGRFKKAPIAAR